MIEAHNVKAAMERGELTEEEAYFILRFAGHFGYKKSIDRLARRGLLSRFRRWLVWFGGWERPLLSQWDEGGPAWEFRHTYPHSGKTKWNDPFPISLFGHCITIYGKWGQIKIGRGYLVAANDAVTRWPNRLYWSPNGTPWHERTKFLIGKRRTA